MQRPSTQQNNFTKQSEQVTMMPRSRPLRSAIRTSKPEKLARSLRCGTPLVTQGWTHQPMQTDTIVPKKTEATQRGDQMLIENGESSLTQVTLDGIEDNIPRKKRNKTTINSRVYFVNNLNNNNNTTNTSTSFKRVELKPSHRRGQSNIESTPLIEDFSRSRYM